MTDDSTTESFWPSAGVDTDRYRKKPPINAAVTSGAPTYSGQRRLVVFAGFTGADGTTGCGAAINPESVVRLSRFRSARSSAAPW